MAGICAALVAITWVVFGQTLGHQFVTYDDPQYVSANPEVARGLSLQGICWAFTHTVAGNWHPVTMISHMLDCQLYGLNPAGHHFTNVLLHSVAVILLFLVLRQMTGALWRSAFVAALFAVHPLHVESVAWIAERKDVLSAVFFMLTLGAYARYARAPSVLSYLLIVFVFGLGLMSKPMLVTLPVVLLLLDYWPLERFQTRTLCRRAPPQATNDNERRMIMLRLVAEKIPLLGMSALSSAVTLVAQFRATGMTDQFPLGWRLGNAAVSYVVYVWQMFWPACLAAFYPYPNDRLPMWQVTLALGFLITASLLAIRFLRERPYIFCGWFWYIVMLVPVSGLVEAGEQARADRYTYLPQIGLYLLVVWSVANLVSPETAADFVWQARRADQRRLRYPGHIGERRASHHRAHKALLVTISATVLILLSWRAFVQASYWRDSSTLWNRALAVTENNDVAHNNLGQLSLERRDFDSAISHFEAALKIRSRSAAAHYKAGSALIENSLASVLVQKGRLREAIDHYDNAISMRPNYGDPYLNLGNVLVRQGQIDEAIAQLEKARGTEPRDGAFHALLGDAFRRVGLERIALAEYEHAVQISTRDLFSRNSLAWLLATSQDASLRDGNRAVELAREAVRLSGGKDARCLRTLAAAFAEVGKFTKAKKIATKALGAAERGRNVILVDALRSEIALYDLNLPCRQ
jgi:tetratricopeptide (TPR) repeat protein